MAKSKWKLRLFKTVKTNASSPFIHLCYENQMEQASRWRGCLSEYQRWKLRTESRLHQTKPDLINNCKEIKSKCWSMWQETSAVSATRNLWKSQALRGEAGWTPDSYHKETSKQVWLWGFSDKMRYIQVNAVFFSLSNLTKVNYKYKLRMW